jgi:riboflavin biosynthesis pyrimidine reductase
LALPRWKADGDSGGGTVRQETVTQKLLDEIKNTIAPKLFNIQHGTASEMQKQIVSECLGFRSLIFFSVLDIREIRRLWDKTNLKFM